MQIVFPIYNSLTILSSAPPAAKSDLKRQLKTYNVRSTIATAIVDQISTSTSIESDAAPAMPTYTAESRSQSVAPKPAAAEVPAFVPEAKVDHVDPAYVNTQRELDEIFNEMRPCFEGKESEGNWLKREQSCTKLRRLNAGNAPADFRDTFLVGIKSLLDGILKAVNSLRTSLSKEGCSVVQEIARTAGPGLDPMVEILLQNLIKLCGGTKKISSQQGNVTVDIIIGRVSYNLRIMQHIWFACQDKNVQPRTYATGWLKTLLKKEAHHKSHVEHTGGLDLIEKCIKKGLADPNPGVRESMRSTYWTFAALWPAKAEAIMDGLDVPAQNKLQNDPSNPNTPKKAETASVRPAAGFSKSTAGPPKLSLRETMLAQKKAQMAASKNAPPRPGSAMSHFSPTRSVSSISTSAVKSSRVETKAPDEKKTVSHGGLSSAPMRPRVKPRPEIARPATAGPYSRRGATTPGGDSVRGDDSTNTSPVSSRRKPLTTNSFSSSTNSPKHMIPRPTTAQSNNSDQSNRSPTREVAPAKASTLKRTSPVRAKSIVGANRARTESPGLATKADEELTMVIPNVNSMSIKDTPSPSPKAPQITVDLEPEQVTAQTPQKPDISIPNKTMKVFEDPEPPAEDRVEPRPESEVPVLEEVPVNGDAANIIRQEPSAGEMNKANEPMSPERTKQSNRLLESGIGKINTKSLDVHGLRKLQGWIRDNKTYPDDKFEALLVGLFGYLEAPLNAITPEKEEDLKLQILSTIKLMLKHNREAFTPYIPRGLEALLQTRSRYKTSQRISNILEGVSEDFVVLADAQQTINSLTPSLLEVDMSGEGYQKLMLGSYVLEQLLKKSPPYMPEDAEIQELGKLAVKCLNSKDSGVRMRASSFCVPFHGRVGDQRFWKAIDGVEDGSKSLLTYYIERGAREASPA